MSTLIKLGIRANVLCIIGIIVAAIAVYAFNLGGWRIGGVTVFNILVFLTYAALIISFLQNLVFKPALSGQAAKLAKQTFMLIGAEDATPGQVAFTHEVIDAKNKHEKIRYISGAVIGALTFFVLGTAFGSPIAEFVALSVLLLGPTLIGFLVRGSLTKMRTLDAELFDSAMQLYSSAHGASFDASLIA